MGLHKSNVEGDGLVFVVRMFVMFRVSVFPPGQGQQNWVRLISSLVLLLLIASKS